MSQKIPVHQVADAAHYVPGQAPVPGKVYTKLIGGFFQNIRNVSMYVVMALFFILPWLRWDGKQAIWLDFPGRQFHIFGATFLPQDLFYLTWIFIMAAFALFVVTVFAGRVFCGYVCPQTIWVNAFMRIEKWFEGERNQRVKFDKQPMTPQKWARRIGKHVVWLLLAFVTALTFVEYFTGVDAMYRNWAPVSLAGMTILLPQVGVLSLIFVVVFTVATYGNAGFMREQFCAQVCPYGRFQSVMFDRDTLIVSYDPYRGEPRGSRKKNAPKPAALGDCIDCELCVQVCPTGIDIRDGLQIECIQCAACIDACDSVMDRMNYPRGLVRYTTERELDEKQPTHWLRPRLLAYSAVLLVVFGAFVMMLTGRDPISLEAIRDRNQIYRVASNGAIENAYVLKITNKTSEPHDYRVTLSNAPGGLQLDSRFETLPLNASEVYSLPVTVVDASGQLRGSMPITFEVVNVSQPDEKTRFTTTFKAPDK